MTSPAPGNRSASVGPNGPLATPTGATAPSINGTVSSNAPPPAVGSNSGGGSQMSQQNLNQIVIDYLNKKGYSRTEAMLRAESANQEVPPHLVNPPTPQTTTSQPKFIEAFKRLKTWTADAMEIYKPELVRILWPFFVYSYLALVKAFYSREASAFFRSFKDPFQKEHDSDLRSLQYITLPEHTDETLAAQNVATSFRTNKYRLTLSNAAFHYFMMWLESLPPEHYKALMSIQQDHLDIRVTDRAADDRFSFASVLARTAEGAEDEPLEDEGIPGHRPGNAVSSTDPNIGNNLTLLRLGKLPMDKDVEDDVRGELSELDLSVPPPGNDPNQTFVKTLDQMEVKQESPTDEGPSRNDIPFPPSTARDVIMEVTKIRENRDRVKLEGRTGGVGPGVSCVMYTFHNTHDKINCIDFSGDQKLVAAGTADSYIRVWTLDGSVLPNDLLDDVQPQQNSHRLIGHAGPVYQVAFAPAAAAYSDDSESLGGAPAKWLLSCSQDGTIRLWNLNVFQCIVVYKGHIGPVWDVAWGPHGHYFVSGGHDKLGRIWTTDSIRPRRLLAGHDNDIEKVAWHPNSAYVFTASCDKTVRMWALSNGNAVRMFTGHTSPITALAGSRDGKKLASADDTGSIFLWDLASGRLIKKMRGHGKGGIWSLSWSVESTVLISGGMDCTVRVWDVTGPPKEPSAAKPGDATAKDGVSTGSGGAAGPVGGVNLGGTGVGGGAKKGRKDAVVTADQISAFLTKDTPVYTVHMTEMNLCLAGGAYLPENRK